MFLSSLLEKCSHFVDATMMRSDNLESTMTISWTPHVGKYEQVSTVYVVLNVALITTSLVINQAQTIYLKRFHQSASWSWQALFSLQLWLLS